VEKLGRPAVSTRPPPDTKIHNTETRPQMITQDQTVDPGSVATESAQLYARSLLENRLTVGAELRHRANPRGMPPSVL
jgi:hypothetical protein